MIPYDITYRSGCVIGGPSRTWISNHIPWCMHHGMWLLIHVLDGPPMAHTHRPTLPDNFSGCFDSFEAILTSSAECPQQWYAYWPNILHRRLAMHGGRSQWFMFGSHGRSSLAVISVPLYLTAVVSVVVASQDTVTTVDRQSAGRLWSSCGVFIEDRPEPCCFVMSCWHCWFDGARPLNNAGRNLWTR